MKKIKPGDLIFYGTSKSNCSHVAMYIGNQKVVHASTERTGITISDYKYRKYVGVGRVLKTETYSTPDVEKEDSVTRYASGK
jgi:cell wall-associated NlpC family hydrolase